MFFVIVVGLALVVALLRGVPVLRLADTRFRAVWLLAVTVGLRVLLYPLVLPADWATRAASPVAPGLPPLGGLVYILTFVCALAFLAANRAQAGFWLILVGLALNFVVIAANGGQMPGDPAALQRAGLLDITLEHLDGRWSPFGVAGPGTALAFLGDVFYVPMPFGRPTLISVGDIVIALGAFAFVNQVALHLASPLGED